MLFGWGSGGGGRGGSRDDVGLTAPFPTGLESGTQCWMSLSLVIEVFFRRFFVFFFFFVKYTRSLLV